ncbi:MAG: fibronectin type III domain-containing protein [Clostridia bacterium]|nr:fibronectin type III domain-containing protein [Clostridia bacterium]
MKKTLALLMALSMMLSCMIGLSVNSAAETEYVEETYDYKMAMLDDFGVVDDIGQNMETGAYESVDGFYFGDVWTYEYYNCETEEFLPMTGFIKAAQDGFTPKYANMYIPYGEVGYSETGLTYIGIWSKGQYLHPGNGGGPVVTFIAPASGTISYDVAVRSTHTDGNYATVWLNDEMIWPKNGDMDSAIFNATNSAAPDIFQISCPSFKVEEGDLVRLCITVVGNRNGKGTSLVETPVVTYHEASIPIGNPDGTPPKNVAASRVNKNTTDTEVTWEEARGAVGYNVYVKASGTEDAPVKVNDQPITELKYTITSDLDFDTLYEATVTSITAEGKESVASDPAGFKTPKGDGKTSDKTSDEGTDTSDTNVPATGNNNKVPTEPSNGFPWLIVVIAAVVVVAVVVVLVLVLGKKKKKPAEAAPAVEAEAAPVEAPAEEAPAEAAAPVEEPAEAPAEEEKKDEE